jgi:hypothetical protein
MKKLTVWFQRGLAGLRELGSLSIGAKFPAGFRAGHGQPVQHATSRVRPAGLTFWWRKALATLGPYAVVELILPGGTVIAVLLWLYRRHQRRLVETHS